MIDRGRNHDVFVTAIEGGISYWAAVEDYDWDRDDWFATIAELEEIGDDEDLPLQTINVWTIIEGRRNLAETGMSQSQPGSTVYGLGAAIKAEDWDTFDDLLDADGADVIVQYGLFGKVVYG